MSWKRVALDVVLCAACLYSAVYMDFHSHPVQRSIRCDDQSVRYKKQKNTITPQEVSTCSLLLPLVSYIVLDLVILQVDLTEAYNNIVSFFLGGSMVYLTGNLLKYNLGTPRPYFIEACKPDWSKIDCSQGNVIDYHCQGDAKEVKFARLSFPSLHAAVAWFGMIYTMFFINKRFMVEKYRHRIWTCAQAFCVTWAVFVSMSRVADYRHHVTDVIAGSIIGVVFASVMVFEWSSLISVEDVVEKLSRHQDGLKPSTVEIEATLSKKIS